MCPVFDHKWGTCGNPKVGDEGCFCKMVFAAKLWWKSCWIKQKNRESEFGWPTELNGFYAEENDIPIREFAAGGYARAEGERAS